MSYASDYDDAEQCTQGEEHGAETKHSSFEDFCTRYFGESSNLSGNELAHAQWSYKQYKKGY